MTISFQIPDELADRLTGEGVDLARAAREAFAIEQYRLGHFELAGVQKTLGMTSPAEAVHWLTERGVNVHYGVEE